MSIKSSKGFSVVESVIVILVIAVLAFAGWYIWQKNNKKDTNKPAGQTQNDTKKPDEQKPADPTEGGKYLVISEWGVRFVLPEGLKGNVTYSLGNSVIDPDNNQLQAAKLLLKNDPEAGNACEIVQKSQSEFFDTAAQFLRVEKSKPFNTQRYKGIFKADLLTDTTNIFHLNYITPDCAGPSATTQIEQMQTAAVQLQKVQ